MASNTVIQTNVLALNSRRNLDTIGTMKEKASAKLSSGYRINSAADDASGLAISEKMRAQIRGLDMASKNAQDGISMLQTTEGGLQEIDNMLQRIRELVVQAANDTNEFSVGSEDRAKVQEEIGQLTSEIKEMGERVEFNKMQVLNFTGKKTFQIGANKGQSISFDFNEVMVNSSIFSVISGVSAAVNAQDWSGITSQISVLDSALDFVSTARAKLGAVINRLEFTNKSLQISSENLSASESRIRDADMGKEMMQLTKANILQQAGVSMLSQANQAPQSVLSLLQ